MTYDFSHLLDGNSPVYPGKKQPVFSQSADIETHGYRETQFGFDSHLGTHIDAPSHMLADGKSLDKLPVEKFTGKAFIVGIPKNTAKIEVAHLEIHSEKITGCDFILFKTGWSQFWGSPAYYKNFPTPTPELLEWLDQFHLKGIGIDAISVDPVESTRFENHYFIFNREMIIIENLNIDVSLGNSTGWFYCLPLPYRNADGSPVRAVFTT